jgi:site-specific recombinase XerD
VTELIGRGAVLADWIAAQESDRTRQEYGYVAARWFEWCDARALDAWQARRGDVDRWRIALARRLRPGTVGKYLACLSSFYDYAARDADPPPVDHNPVRNVRRPRIEKVSHADGLTAAEARALLESAKKDGPRTAALVHLLLGTAARVSEIVNATVGDLCWSEGRRALKVTRKGGAEGFVLIRPAVWETVSAYLDGRKEVPEGWLIATSGGRRMTRQTAYETVRELADTTFQRDGFTIGPHDLRHTAITLALDGGMELQEARMFAGHARAATTERYDRRAHTRGAAAAEAVETALHGGRATPAQVAS